MKSMNIMYRNTYMSVKHRDSMPKKKRTGWTTIGIPIHVRDGLKEYGTFGETWADLLERLIREVDESKRLKERYRLK